MKINEITNNIPLDEIKRILEDNCSDAVNGTPIWRGGTKKTSIVNSTNLPLRPSANTYNYVNLFISTRKAWQNFPRRQIICSTNRMYAAGYGDVHRVFPFNGTVIGICPEQDFWMMPYLKSFTEEYVNGLDIDIAQLQDVLGRSLSPKDPAVLLNDLKETAIEWMASQPEKLFLDKFKIENSMSIINILEDLLDPIKNKFEIGTVNTLPKEREVWFDGEALIIPEKLSWELGITEFKFKSKR